MRHGWVSINFPLCFPGDSQVLLENGQHKTMSQLKIGDKILVAKKDGSLSFDTVYNFLHREVNPTAPYTEIVLSNSTKITLSAYHLIFRAGKDNSYEAVPACEIRTGDVLYVSNYNPVNFCHETSTVTVTERVDDVIKQGIYAPLTFSGTIVVDQVLASCYAQYDKIKSHNVSHAALKPLRIRAKMTRKQSRDEKEMKEGWNPYCSFLGKGVYPLYRVFAS